jgi:hypothetical protein
MGSGSARRVVMLLLGIAPLAGCGTDDDGIATKTAALTVPVPTVSQFAVMASRSVNVNDRSHVIGGDLGVAASATATPNTLTAGFDTRIGVGEVLLAQSVTLRDRAVAGEIGANQINAPFATTGPRSPFEPPPAQPVPGPIAPGTAPVTVNSGQTVTLPPGAFGAVTVNGTLNLAGGVYQFQSLRLNNDARLIAVGASIVRVAGVLTALDRARLLPAAPQQAGALRLIVGGATDGLVLSNDVQLTALVVARGDFRAGDRLIAAGAVAARDVIIGHDGRFTFNTGFGCGSNASCDDANACTNDVCLDAQCVRTPAPNGSVCSDGNACTQTDRCQAGACAGSNPVVCTASDQCHDAGVCNPASGVCSNPARPNGTACSDANGCTQADTCQAGACVGGNPVTCTASDQCHDAGVCNPASGVCSNPARPDGTACSDANACTQADVCVMGACMGGNPVVCMASDQCHDVGVCDPASGVCSNPARPDGTACSDANACTQADVCETGACVGGNPVVCTASDQCHDVGVCDVGTGVCSNPARPNGTACNDGNECTQGETCQAGVCTSSGPDGGTCGAVTLSMVITLPMSHQPAGPAASVFPQDVALYGAQQTDTSVLIDNDVDVFEGISTTVWAPVTNAGSGRVLLSPGVDTGDVWSVGFVDFPPPTGTAPIVVHGDLRTSGGADEAAGQVTGIVIDPAVLGMGTTTITASFPTPAPAPIVHNDSSTLTLTPGGYGDVVFNAGTLSLTAGTYSFESLTMNNGSTLAVNNATGVVRVNVRTLMIFRAAMPATITTQNLRFAVFGAGGATLGGGAGTATVFRGTVVATNGPLAIEGGLRTYRGGFFGRSVVVFNGATIQHFAFSDWETPTTSPL